MQQSEIVKPKSNLHAGHSQYCFINVKRKCNVLFEIFRYIVNSFQICRMYFKSWAKNWRPRKLRWNLNCKVYALEIHKISTVRTVSDREYVSVYGPQIKKPKISCRSKGTHHNQLYQTLIANKKYCKLIVYGTVAWDRLIIKVAFLLVVNQKRFRFKRLVWTSKKNIIII